MKKNTEWEVLTPLGWKDFDGVSKTEVPMDRVVVVELVDGTSLTCSAGHQVTLKRYDEVSHVFVELIEPEYGEDAILTKNGFVKVKSVTKHVEEKTVDMYDLVNVDGGYEYYTNDIVSHNCAHIDDMAEIWVGIQPTLSCVTGDTLVLTNNGFQKIEDFHANKQVGDYFDLEIPIYGKNGMEKTSHGYVSPNSETVIIQTSHGHKVEVTPIHPLYVLQDTGIGKMVQAQNLKLDSYLRIEVGQNIFGNENLDPDVAYMLGGYIAEGWIAKRRNTSGDWKYDSIEVENTDSGFRDVYLSNSLVKPFSVVPSRTTRLRCSSRELISKWIEYGIDPHACCYNKQTPRAVLEGTKSTVVNYLSGLFDGDGSVTTSGIVYSTTSEKLARETSLLLHNLGFVTNVHHVSPRTSELGRIMPQGKPLQSLRDSWRVIVMRSQFEKFANEIGFRINRKQKLLLKLATEFDQNSRKLLTVPASLVESSLCSLLERSGKSQRWFRGHYNIRFDKALAKDNHKRVVTQEWLIRTKKAFSDLLTLSKKDLEFYSETIGSFYWDKIHSLAESCNKTYDFTVPETHTFLQNGILGSNTGGQAILISSPNGVGNTFHRIWVDAIEEKNDFVAIELPWTVHPERDQAWYEKESNNIRAGNGERGVQQEFHCVPGETKVVTLDGCKNIKDISVGDKVLTHQGRFRKVYATHKHSYDPTSESLYTVSAPGNRRQSLLITGNHPVLNYKFKLRKHQSAKEMLLANKASFDGFDVLDLWKHEGANHTRKIIYNALFPQCSIGSLLEENKEHVLLSDFCTGANLQVSEEGHCRVHRQNKNKTSPIENQQTLSFDFGRFVGLFAAEGFSAEKNFGFAFHLDEKDTLVSFVESFLKNFGACYYTKIRDYSKCITVCSTNKIMKSVLEQFVKQESGATTKHYNMDALLKTNPEFIRGVVVGHFEGDGDHPKNGLNRKLKVSCYSPKMLYQLKVLLSCYGLFGRIGNWYDSIAYYELDGLDNLEQQNRNIDFLTRQSNTHKLLEKPNSRTVLFEQERQFVGKVQFSKASQELQAGMKSEALELYNISVEEDESYIADSIVVHNCSFNASGDTFVKSEILGIIEENCSEPIAKHNKWPELWIWKHPEPGHNYLISADVSRGNSADFSACQVFNTTTDEIVAEYKGKIYPDKLAELLIEVGTRYNTALICPELNTYGAHTATELKKANYGNLYYEKMHKNIYMAFSNIEVSDDELPGWTSGPKSRDEIIAKLEAVLRKQTIRLPSKRLVNELKTFIWKNNKAQAMKGYNDDLVMALAIGVNLYETSGRPQYSHEEIAKGMLAGMSTRGSQMNAGLSDWGVTEVQGSPVPGQVAKNNPWLKVQKPNPFQKNPKSVQNHNDPFWRQWGWLND